MSNTTNLQLPYLDANQNQKTVTVNQALTMLDALVNCQVQSAALTAPPASPGDGQCWIVGSGSSGAWAGKDLNVAAWQDGAWAFYPPTKGMLVYNDATGALDVWTGSAWLAIAGTDLQFAALGIGTAPDNGNPLSATLNNALFNALGTGSGGSGDIRVKLNKAAVANTASLLFQDGFSGRAEIGLTGDNNFHFKVSSDGSTFREALVLNAATGDVRVPSLNGGALAGLRNRIVNGAFAINQRAYGSGSSLAAGRYGFDRWKAGSGGATLTFTASRPDTAVTVASGTLAQVIEDQNVEGGTYTLSWTGTATGRIYQGTASGAYGAGPLTVTGLTAGTAVTIEFSTGTLGGVQFEPGPVATPFERRPAGLELALCQRYFYKTYEQAVAPGTPTGSYSPIYNWFPIAGTYYTLSFLFPVVMRAAPTMTIFSAQSGATGHLNAGTTDVLAYVATVGSAGASIAVNNSSVQGGLSGHVTAEAEL